MSRSRGIPDWADEPFERFDTYSREEMKLVELAARGIEMLVGHEKVVQALVRLDEARRTEAHRVRTKKGLPRNAEAGAQSASQRLEEARELAAIAREEVKRGFPLLHGHSLVGLWGALETLVEEIVIAWLSHRRKLLATGEFAAVRVPLAEFERMTRRERLEHLIEQVPRKAGIGSGFPRLEEMLAKVGLAGALDEELRRTLIEAQQIRNVFAHKGGVADRRLVAACPWRKDWRVGQAVAMDVDEYGRLATALVLYATELYIRTGDRFGLDIRPMLAQHDERHRKP